MESTREHHRNGAVHNGSGFTSATLQDMSKHFKEITHQVSDSAMKFAHDVAEKSCDAYSACSVQGKKIMEKTEEQVRSNPLMSMLVSAGIGALLYRTLIRK